MTDQFGASEGHPADGARAVPRRKVLVSWELWNRWTLVDLPELNRAVLSGREPAANLTAALRRALTDDLPLPETFAPDEARRLLVVLGLAGSSVARHSQEADPDRAAQLVRNALTTGDPTTLAIPTLTLVLSALRDRAADVADEVFPEALNFIASAPQPSTANLSELGEYLFTAPKDREVPDLLQASDLHQVGDTRIANFAANRRSTNPEDIRAYIDAALKVLSASNDVYYDPVAAYAIALQLLPKTDDFAPNRTAELRKLLGLTLVQAGSAAAKVQAALAGPQGADPEGGEGPRLRDRVVGRVLSLTTAQRFVEARELTTSIGDVAVSSQVNALIDFAQAATVLGDKDATWAFALARSLKPGVKPALLYAGAVAAAPDPDSALGYFQLGLLDAEVLPAEQRLAVTAALAAVMLPRDQDNGLFALRQVLQAANEAYMTPHEGRFDPQVIHKAYSSLHPLDLTPQSDTSTATDSPLVIANSRCTCEVVDTGLGRHYFNLKVPGVTTLTLSGLVRNALGIDPRRLESILIGLQDEQRLASALNASLPFGLADAFRGQALTAAAGIEQGDVARCRAARRRGLPVTVANPGFVRRARVGITAVHLPTPRMRTGVPAQPVKPEVR